MGKEVEATAVCHNIVDKEQSLHIAILTLSIALSLCWPTFITVSHYYHHDTILMAF